MSDKSEAEKAAEEWALRIIRGLCDSAVCSNSFTPVHIPAKARIEVDFLAGAKWERERLLTAFSAIASVEEFRKQLEEMCIGVNDLMRG